MSFVSDETRRSFGEGDAIRDADQKNPEGVVRFDNLKYGFDDKENILDIYRPDTGDKLKKLPVIFNVHGGGWVYGNKEVYQFYGMSLAMRGFAFVNITYRLAPESPFPAQIVDIDAAIKWSLEHAEEYGLDTNNLFLVGDSAGGHMGAMYANLLTNDVYRSKLETKYGFELKTVGTRLNAVALNCGCYDMPSSVKFSHGFSNAAYLLLDFLGYPGVSEEPVLDEVLKNYPIPDEELELISPNNYVNDCFPPTFLMSAEGDFLKFQIPFMEDELKKHNIPYKCRIYGNENEPLYHVFHCNMNEKQGGICNDDEMEFFKEYIR